MTAKTFAISEDAVAVGAFLGAFWRAFALVTVAFFALVCASMPSFVMVRRDAIVTAVALAIKALNVGYAVEMFVMVIDIYGVIAVYGRIASIDDFVQFLCAYRPYLLVNNLFEFWNVGHRSLRELRDIGSYA